MYSMNGIVGHDLSDSQMIGVKDKCMSQSRIFFSLMDKVGYKLDKERKKEHRHVNTWRKLESFKEWNQIWIGLDWFLVKFKIFVLIKEYSMF